MRNKDKIKYRAGEVCGRGEVDFKPSRNKKIDEDYDGPQKQRMKPAHSYKYSYTRTVSLVEKVIKARIGQPWDKVYSELTAKFGHQVKKEGWQSLKDCIFFFTENPVFDGDRVLDPSGYPVDYYVEDGILKKANRFRRFYKKVKFGEFVKTLDGKEYFYHNDMWWRVRFLPIPENRRKISKNLWSGSQDDAFFGPLCHLSEYQLTVHYGKSVYASWKQQANSKESKKLNKLL